MDFFEIIKTRRSIRKFLPKPVSLDIIKKIIDLAITAPSACNYQLWRFIVVDSQELKEKIVDLGGAIAIKEAPVGVLVTYNNQTANQEYKDYIQSAAAAIENMLLAAHAYGLGGCWVCQLPPKTQLRRLFKIPANFDPIAYVLLGYPAITPREMPRKFNGEQVMSINQFNFENNSTINEKTWLKRFLRNIYNHTPLFIKKSFLNKLIDKKFVKKFDN